MKFTVYSSKIDETLFVQAFCEKITESKIARIEDISIN